MSPIDHLRQQRLPLPALHRGLAVVGSGGHHLVRVHVERALDAVHVQAVKDLAGKKEIFG